VKMPTPKERNQIDKLLSGRMNINTKAAQNLLAKDHIAITFSRLLETKGLSDDKLVGKMKEILNRKEHKSTNINTGTISTNQTQVDANAINVLKISLQLKNKFDEELETKKDEFQKLGDDQLDEVITGGTTFLKDRGVLEALKEEDSD